MTGAFYHRLSAFSKHDECDRERQGEAEAQRVRTGNVQLVLQTRMLMQQRDLDYARM